jgi:hypothetical protein
MRMFKALTAALVLSSCATSTPQLSPHRSYRDGESFSYEMTTRAFHNGQLTGATRAISVHSVNANTETIRWVSLIESEVDHTDIAQQVAPYTVSLAEGGSLDLPPLDFPAMTGSITDLHTFYVAVSERLGLSGLTAVGDSTVSDALIGDWADGEDILLGKDCTRATLTLIERTADTATLEARFTPPSEPCFEPAYDWMSERIDASLPNNFQQVRVNGEQRMAMWGLEQFSVRVVIDRDSGRILSGTLENLLQLTIRGGCTAELSNCQFETPMEIRRHVELRDR